MKPWMPFYPADFIGDTQHLTAAEIGAYIRLIAHYWSRDGLPSDERRLAHIAGVTEAEWAEIRDTLAEFFDEGWRHRRIEREMAKAAAKYEQRVIASRKGVEARKAKLHSEPSGQPSGKPSGEPTTTTTTTISNNSSPKRAASSRGSRIPDDFEPDLQEAVQLGLSHQQARKEADAFRDYWRAVPGNRGVKSDWSATWRNWCRKTSERFPSSQASQRRNFIDAAIDMTRGHDNEFEDPFSAGRNAQRIPAVQQQSRPVIADLRRRSERP